MSVAKVTEITATSTKGFEEAVKAGIARATKTLKNVQGAWIKGFKVEIENGKVRTFRVDMKVTFVLDD
jgi:flavin-binding protein dodecin